MADYPDYHYMSGMRGMQHGLRDGMQHGAAGGRSAEWPDLRGRTAAPAPAQAAQLLRRVAPPQRDIITSADWFGVERTLGTALPKDYRSLIDDRGPGIVADVVVYGPEKGSPLDLVAWNEGIHRLIESIRQICRDYFPLAFHPEPTGVLPWGSVNGGQIVGWAVTSADPDTWPVVELSAELDALVLHEVTTTGYLLARLPGPQVPTLITG
ncbi:SMI1/KNR4 family protein [Cryptosporangium phraense]|uniref:SMI1/KNR4 family protein n=1 Tax=Cryptosporangium phraense TaxID=2593070 RepID=A0A545ALT5_9ACTN|nr:SMI1/KNR4 family protein [Cryptosporangium phraense]TQS42279.1 hypothetical protein FL583_25445 [Cryptosporangium phraense]